jgi:hypothetical protein
MAGLRIEIEKRLRELASLHEVRTTRGVRGLLDDLRSAGVISRDEHGVLADLVGLGNNAAHGAEVPPGAVVWATDVGPQLLAALDEKIADGKSV